MSQPLLHSGARGVVKYTDAAGNLKTLALALNIDVSINQGVRQTYVMGSKNPVMQDPLSIDVTCSVGRVVPVNSATSQDVSVESQMTAIGLGLEATINASLESESLTIQLVDKITGKVIANIKEARFAGRSMSVNAQDVASERINFVGIYDAGYDNENGGVLLGYDSSQA
jgi:hypothetical protein